MFGIFLPVKNPERALEKLLFDNFSTVRIGTLLRKESVGAGSQCGDIYKLAGLHLAGLYQSAGLIENLYRTGLMQVQLNRSGARIWPGAQRNTIFRLRIYGR